MGDYFAHWLKMGKAVARPPRIFRVNWFRKDANGKFIWPGFAENMRVLKWIVDRCGGRGQGAETALGVIPRYEDLNWTGLERIDSARYEELACVDEQAWGVELKSHDELFGRLGRPPAGGARSAPRQHAPEARRLGSGFSRAAGEQPRCERQCGGGRRIPPAIWRIRAARRRGQTQPDAGKQPVEDQVNASVECSGRELPATNIACMISAGCHGDARSHAADAERPGRGQQGERHHAKPISPA
jgi:hypothetical protein